MEHANGFTPTHTEHKIISYPAYQTAEEKKVWSGEKNILKMWNQEIQKQIDCLLKPMGYWNKLCKYNWCQINLLCGRFFGIHWLWTIRMKVDLPTAYFLNNKKQRMLCERMQNCLKTLTDIHAAV